MTGLKKIIFAACLGLGLGASFSAFAIPDYDTCVEMRDACLDGDSNACTTFGRVCRIYNIPL